MLRGTVGRGCTWGIYGGKGGGVGHDGYGYGLLTQGGFHTIQNEMLGLIRWLLSSLDLVSNSKRDHWLLVTVSLVCLK